MARYAHTVEQVRRAESALMATLPPGTLMQRAAAGLATACADFLGGVYGAHVLVLAGSGDNGGDALFAGARLARRGARVSALALADRVHGEGLAALRRAGGVVVSSPPARLDLVLDGIVGIGGSGGLREAAARVVEALSAPVVAVDVPSGIGVDTGELSGSHVQAALTVTFGTHKVGLLVDPAAAAAGAAELVDIGLGPHLGAPAVEVLQETDVRRLLPHPGRAAHKYSRGVVGVRAGSTQYTGAGLLTTGAAVRCGLAGMVRYEGASADLVRQRFPEVVIGRGRVQAWVVGSGLGADAETVVPTVLEERLPTVIDADGLAHLPDRFAGPVVLTPHAGELAQMLEMARPDVEARPLDAARTAALRWHAVVLLKGARSLIAAPDERVRVNTTGLPWLAAAGAGDVLSGLVGALLAAGLSPYDAASVGAFVHGAAATLASGGGPISASDLLETLAGATASMTRNEAHC
jgi:ADP-dependent NAD(P)H-hydrate dehydratase / NAD(P)H-hydrate epimerase